MNKKVILSFPAETADLPIANVLVRQFDIQINILKASIESGKTGTMFVELNADNEKIQQAFNYLEEKGITISLIESRISFDETKCIDCGNCVSACISQALSISKPDWKLKFKPENCMLCKLCLKTCPLQLFKIEFSEQQ